MKFLDHNNELFAINGIVPLHRFENIDQALPFKHQYNSEYVVKHSQGFLFITHVADAQFMDIVDDSLDDLSDVDKDEPKILSQQSLAK